MSIFDVIGPVMVGPSSSHTAGAVRIPDSLDIASSQGMYDAMKNADSGYDGNLRSASGLAAGIETEVICFL